MTSLEMFLLFIATPAVLVLALIEAVILSRRHRYDWRAFGVSVFDLITRIGLNIVLPLSIAAPLVHLAYSNRLGTIELNGWAAILLMFFGQEFCYYWLHRSAHRVRWFWANHAVHHSTNELNLSAALRIGIFGKLAGNAVFFLPLIWLGFAPRTVFAALSINLLYQFWIHATWIPKLGWLEGIFNTASAHRVHHASNLAYLDANYGGVLVIFDRLFGTYVKERDDLPCHYGLVHPLTSYNVVTVELFEWKNLLRDLSSARSLRAFMGYLFMPPGWAPNGMSNTTEAMRQRAGAEHAKHPASMPKATSTI